MTFSSQFHKIKSRVSSPAIMNLLWLSFDKSLKLFIGLFVGIWVARYLGPAQWGELNYILAFVTIISTIAKLGMDGFLVKEILQHPENKNEILGTSFAMRVAILPISLAVVLLYFYIKNFPVNHYWMFTLLSLSVLVTPLDLIDLDFQSRLQSKLTVVSKNIAYVLGAIFRVYLIITSKSLIWFAAAMGIEAALSYLFLLVIYQNKSNIFRWTFSFKTFQNLIISAWPFTISSLAVILYMRLDQVMLGSLVNEKELGYFSAVVKISDIFIFLPMAIASSYLPSLVKAKKESILLFQKSIQFLFNWMTRISILIAIVVSLFANQIIMALYGSEYLNATAVLVVHIWSLIPIFSGVASSQYLVIQNLQKLSLYRTLFGLIINIVLNLFLIPKYGAFGASIATAISQTFAAILSMAVFSKTKILFTMQLKSFFMLLKFKK